MKGFQTWPSCNRMNDDQFHTYASRLTRISSCKVQNCGTGYCQTGNNRKTCVCSRCADGGKWI
ncbi:unnamed protein product, partial [Adineta steineri]